MDPRDPLLTLLRNYQPIDPEDRLAHQRIVDFVQRSPQCFDRENLDGHITGSAWLVDSSTRQVLLTHHKKLDKWLQLGGHCDGNPDVLQVAIREAQEESGITNIVPIDGAIFDVDIHPIPPRPHEPAHLHYDVRFALKTNGHEPFAVGAESHDLAWVRINELKKVTAERSLLRMGEKWNIIQSYE